jgi:hypothetical protein
MLSFLLHAWCGAQISAPWSNSTLTAMPVNRTAIRGSGSSNAQNHFRLVNAPPLPLINFPLSVDSQQVSISGISSGADFASYFQVAHSASIVGSGIFAGNVYRCYTTRFEGEPLVDCNATPSSHLAAGCADTRGWDPFQAACDPDVVPCMPKRQGPHDQQMPGLRRAQQHLGKENLRGCISTGLDERQQWRLSWSFFSKARQKRESSPLARMLQREIDVTKLNALLGSRAGEPRVAGNWEWPGFTRGRVNLRRIAIRVLRQKRVKSSMSISQKFRQNKESRNRCLAVGVCYEVYKTSRVVSPRRYPIRQWFNR